MHRILVSISLDITDLEIHHMDRNSLNDRIDNLLPVTKEEHDLIHELEKDDDDIIYSSRILKLKSITTYTKNRIAKNIKDKKLSTEMASEITGKPLKEINIWLADYKKYGRVGSREQKPVNNMYKLPDFYIIQMLKLYYIDRLSIEETREELLKSNLFNPKTKKPVTLTTIKKYIDGHPHFVEWYNTYKDS
ncbi:MAG: HNH endonuclease [Cyanobacteriota bacterium]